jgi:hypothetical protein
MKSKHAFLFILLATIIQTVWNPSADFPKINFFTLSIDVLLWFLILVVGWLLIKKMKRKAVINNYYKL